MYQNSICMRNFCAEQYFTSMEVLATPVLTSDTQWQLRALSGKVDALMIMFGTLSSKFDKCLELLQSQQLLSSLAAGPVHAGLEYTS